MTAADAGDAAAPLPDRGAAEGWTPERVRVEGISIGAGTAQAAAPHGVEVQATIRDRDATGATLLPLRWHVEGSFGTPTNPDDRLTRNLEQSCAAAQDAVTIADRHRLIRATDSRDG